MTKKIQNAAEHAMEPSHSTTMANESARHSLVFGGFALPVRLHYSRLSRVRMLAEITVTKLSADRPLMQKTMAAADFADWTDLLAAARSGDDDALGEICHRLRNYLLLAAAGNLGRDLTAKLGASDIVQETMLEACRDFKAFQGASEGEFRAWVQRLLERNLIDSVRSFRLAQNRRVERELSLDQAGVHATFAGEAATASSILRQRETDEELLRAVARLPETQRRVIEMRHRDGLAYREIAAALGMTQEAARKTWSRAVQQLSRELSPRP